MLCYIDSEEGWCSCVRMQSTQFGSDCTCCLPFWEWWFSALIWICFHTRVAYTWAWEFCGFTHRGWGALSPALSTLVFFLYAPTARGSFPGASDQKDGSFLSERSMYHLASSSPTSHPQDNAARKTTGTFIPTVVSPSFGFPSQFECLCFSEASGSCFLCFDKFFIFNQQERDARACACHHAESGTCHLFFWCLLKY